MCFTNREGQNIISVISNGVIGSKKNDDKGYGPIADASSLPTVAKCMFSTSEISCTIVVTTFSRTSNGWMDGS